MKNVSSGRTRGNHPHLRKNKKKKKKKKKSYAKYLKRLRQKRNTKGILKILKERKTVSEQSQDELEPIISTPINSPMSDE